MPPTNVGGYKNAVDIKFIMYRYVFILKNKGENNHEKENFFDDKKRGTGKRAQGTGTKG